MALADDFILSVRQIAQYPLVTTTGPADAALIQQGGLGGPYKSIKPPDFVGTALELGGFLHLAPGPAGGIAFNGAALTFAGGSFEFSENVHVPSLHSDGDIFVNGIALANQIEVTALFDQILLNSVWSFNGRNGNVLLTTDDVLRAGAAPITNPHFNGWVTAPTSWNVHAADDTVATTAWVQQVICQNAVHSFMCRQGDVVLSAADVTFALTQPGVYGRANTPPLGDTSTRIATTMFVDGSIADLQTWVNMVFETKTEALLLPYAPLDSPNFTGVPTAPTPNPGTSTGQLATCAFVAAAVTASTTGVSSFNTRTGAVTLTALDVTNAGGAVLNSPVFVGNPTAPTAAPGDNDTSLATTAFVHAAVAAIAAGVSSFNTRTGAVTLVLADVTAIGGAPIASPTFTGNPQAPTPAPSDNDTSVATTAYVTNALAALPAPVTSFNGRTGVVSLLGADVSAAGGALVNSPTFIGTPAAPTPTAGDSSTKLATTAFVAGAIAASVTGVASFNSRTGVVVLTAADVTGVGGALIASPTFTGVPAAPTATIGTNSTQLATTAFVQAALSAAPGGVSSFNTRTGAITLLGADVSAAGGALINSPNFTGNPTAPTATPGDNDTTIATTAFVAAAIAAGGGVISFNGRAGAVTLSATDIFNASGAVYRQSDTAPAGTPQTLWFDSIGGQLYVQYVDPSTSAKSWVVANTPVASGITYSATVFPATGAPANATTTAATFTTPANSSVNTIWKVRQQAAGGGGGGIQAGATVIGSNGAGGEFKEYLLSGVAASTAITLAIGNAGLQGNAGVNAPGAGGNTTLSFGTTSIVCGGGGGGINVAGSTFQYSGKGGTGGATTPGSATVQMLRQVNGGDGPATVSSSGGSGGPAVLGIPGMQRPSGSTATTDGGGYGCGGAGAWNGTQGWNGQGGVVIFERIAG